MGRSPSRQVITLQALCQSFICNDLNRVKKVASEKGHMSQNYDLTM